MRDIKFKLMLDGKHVGFEKHTTRGIYHSDKDRRLMLHTNEDTVWIEITSCYSSFRTENGSYIKHDRKLQFIGLHDANGHEMYEGDTIKGYSDELAEIRWDSNRCRYYMRYTNDDIGFPSGQKPERFFIIKKETTND